MSFVDALYKHPYHHHTLQHSGRSNKYQRVPNLQREYYRLKEDKQNTVKETNALQTSVKFLNDEVEATNKKH